VSVAGVVHPIPGVWGGREDGTPGFGEEAEVDEFLYRDFGGVQDGEGGSVDLVARGQGDGPVVRGAVVPRTIRAY
jgi:hypothetical protein